MIDAPALGFAVLGVEKPTGLFNGPHVIRHWNAASLTISPVGAVNQQDGP